MKWRLNIGSKILILTIPITMIGVLLAAGIAAQSSRAVDSGEGAEGAAD